ncbi:MAG: ATP-binding protein [Acidimicrobiia bacterium]
MVAGSRLSSAEECDTASKAVLVTADPGVVDAAFEMLSGLTAIDWHVVTDPDFGQLHDMAGAMVPDFVVVDSTGMSSDAAMVGTVEPWRKDTPVIVVTDRTDPHLDRMLIAAGASDVVVRHELRKGDLRRVVHVAILREATATKGRAISTNSAAGLPLAFYRYSPDGRLLYANEAAVQLLGYPSLESLLATPGSELLRDARSRETWMKSTERDRRLSGVEVELMHFSGRGVYVWLTAQAVRDPRGATLYYEATAIDMTDWKQAFKAQEEAQSRLQNFFELTPAAYWIEDFSALSAWLESLRRSGVDDIRRYLDDNTDEVTFGMELVRIVDMNPAALALIGATDKEATIDEGLAILATEDTLSLFGEQIVAAWEGRSSLRTIGVGKTLNGDPIEFILTWVVAVNGGSDLSTVIVSIEDITELSEVRRRLAKLVGVKDRFIDSISHELRTPLTAVLGFAEHLRDGFDQVNKDDLDDYLDRLASEAAGASALLDDLLLTNELNATGDGFDGKLTLRRERVDLVEAASAVVAALPPDVRAQVRVAGESVTAVADPGRVRQIIRNLVSNAIKHGGPHVVVRGHKSNDRACVAVLDDGSGIPPEDVERAFARFEGAEPTRGLTETLGVGLTVSSALARAMGGELRYEQLAGTTLFRVELPATESQDRP